MRFRKIYFLFLFLFFLTSCGNFSEIIIGDINGVTIEGFEENAMIVEVSVPVDNPTLHRITVSHFDTKVFMNGTYLGKVNSKDPIVLKARSQEVYDLVFEVHLANAFGTALTLMNLKSGQKVQFRMQGTVNARTLLVRKKIDINESREVTI